MRLFMILIAALYAAPAFAQRVDLPATEKVADALDHHPNVAAAAARLTSARARASMLATGSHELMLSGSYFRRSIDQDRTYDEFDTTLSRAVRLPGKAALDREAGALSVEVAQNQMEDMRHQTSLILSGRRTTERGGCLGRPRAR